MIGPTLLNMLMPDSGRIDVSGETGLAWKAGGQTELKPKAPSWEEAFHFRHCGIDRGSVFIDVRQPCSQLQPYLGNVEVILKAPHSGDKLPE